MNLRHDPTWTSRLVANCLGQVIVYFERQRNLGRPNNVHCLQLARDATVLLGTGDLAARMEAILAPLTVGDLFQGAIMNWRLTPEEARKPIPRRTLQEIERAYPVLGNDYVPDLLSKGGDHLRYCMERSSELASKHAPGEAEQIEVGLARAMLGDFAGAQAVFDRYPNRASELSLVLAIEMHRRCLFDNAEQIVSVLLDEDSNWTPTMLALGVSGRVPWSCYPFPDY